jgi:hypothetical protein
MGFAVVEDSSGTSSRSQRDRSPNSVSMTHSPTPASHDAASEEASFSEEDSPVPLTEKGKEGPPAPSHAPSGLRAASLTGKKKINSSKLAGSESGIHTTTLPPGGKKFFGDDFPIPVDENYQSSSNGEDDLYVSVLTHEHG